jgi:DNA-binding IclR family transcriptional regulator
MPPSFVKSVLKALDILQFVSESKASLSVSQIASGLKMNRTTTHRLVNTLATGGYLGKSENKNTFQVGLKLLPIAARVLDGIKLRVEALPHLQELSRKCGERVNLGILYEGEVLYLGGVEKPTLPIVYSRFGKKAPAHCCSLGKVILAHMPEKEWDSFFKKNLLAKVTEKTITSPQKFRKHLLEIREQGFALDQEEHIPGTFCIAGLIRGPGGQGLGAISISSNNPTKVRGFLGDLLHTAEVISHRMGVSNHY